MGRWNERHINNGLLNGNQQYRKPLEFEPKDQQLYLFKIKWNPVNKIDHHTARVTNQAFHHQIFLKMSSDWWASCKARLLSAMAFWRAAVYGVWKSHAPSNFLATNFQQLTPTQGFKMLCHILLVLASVKLTPTSWQLGVEPSGNRTIRDLRLQSVLNDWLLLAVSTQIWLLYYCRHFKVFARISASAKWVLNFFLHPRDIWPGL